MKDIRSIAKRIAEKFDVEKIILFGSYAYGKPATTSDIDLCVVMETKDRPFAKSLEILQALSPLQFGIDIVVRNEKDFKRRIPQGDVFLEDIWNRGIILFPK